MWRQTEGSKHRFSKYFSIVRYFRIFSKENRKKKEEDTEREKKETIKSPSGKELEIFIQRNFLPINVSVHPDQNLQRVYHPKPKHFSLFLSEKQRMLIL